MGVNLHITQEVILVNLTVTMKVILVNLTITMEVILANLPITMEVTMTGEIYTQITTIILEEVVILAMIGPTCIQTITMITQAEVILANHHITMEEILGNQHMIIVTITTILEAAKVLELAWIGTMMMRKTMTNMMKMKTSGADNLSNLRKINQ